MSLAQRENERAVAQTLKEASWYATHDGVVVDMPETPEAVTRDDRALYDFATKDVDTEEIGGTSEARLFRGTPEPLRELQKERPIHRIAAFMVAAGASFQEVARRLDVHHNTVSNWFRQKWFQEYVDDEIRAAGIDPLKNLLAGAAKDCVLTLIELRDDEKVPASVRAKAASDILDRAYGKAPSVVHNVQHTGQAMTDITAVEREIRELMSSPGAKMERADEDAKHA